MSAKCFRSMRKNEPPHSLQVAVNVGKTVSGARCSCIAGVSGYCHHVIGLLFSIAHCKRLGLKALPDEVTCTSTPQRWNKQKEVQNLLVKKPQHCLRKKRITASKFGTFAKRVSGFENLVSQLNPSRRVVTAAMRRGIELEARAAMVYSSAVKCQSDDIPKTNSTTKILE